MPTVSDTAICIRRWEFSETSQTASLFTRGHGIIRGLAKGAHRPKGAFSGGIDVLTAGQVMAIVKAGSELATITAWHLQELYAHLRRHLAANRASLYMADLVHHMVIDHDPHPRLFDALDSGLRALADPAAVDPALLRFQWATLDECGYRPQLSRDARTGRELSGQETNLSFDPRAGGVIIAQPDPQPASAPGSAVAWRVRRQTVELLRGMDQPDAAAPASVASDVVGRANRLLAAYVRELVGRELPTMRWAFSDGGQ